MIPSGIEAPSSAGGESRNSKKGMQKKESRSERDYEANEMGMDIMFNEDGD